jgi:hypothetical protein
MTPPTRHAFRYEPGLCSLGEGETLARRRPEDAPEPRKHRGGLLARLTLRRSAGRQRSTR